MTGAVETSTPVVVLKLYHQCGLGVTRTLGRFGVPVYAVHETRRSPAARSRYLREVFAWNLDREPPEDSVAFLRDLAARIGGRPILVPTDDLTAMLVADHQDALADAFAFPLQPPGLARALGSKRGMDQLCREHGIPTPDTEFPQSRGEAEAFAEQAQYPVVVKALDPALVQSAGGAKAIAIVHHARELLAAYDALEDPARPNLILQQYIPGGPESIWMFNGYFDERSECRFAAVGRKIRQYPPGTGETSLGVCVENREVDALTRRLMREVGYRGVLDCGYRWDPRDGEYKLLDVNPRVGATFRLFAAAGGLDVVRALYLDLTGQAIPPDAVRPGRRWLVENYELETTARRLLADRRLDVREWGRPLRGVEELAWFAADDPMPFAAMAARVGATAARRRAGTADARLPGTRGDESRHRDAIACQPGRGAGGDGAR